MQVYIVSGRIGGIVCVVGRPASAFLFDHALQVLWVSGVILASLWADPGTLPGKARLLLLAAHGDVARYLCNCSVADSSGAPWSALFISQ